jgi:uncharacterized protein (TIGR04255 family)
MPFVPEDRHYDHAPIKEALIGLVVEPPNSSTMLADLSKLDFLTRGYSKSTPLHQAQFENRFESGIATAKANNEQIGYEFVGHDRLHVVRMELERFSFSRLAPYDCWRQLRDEAREMWNSYRTLVAGRSVTQIGLRFINQIDMPEAVRDFREYIRTYPEISSDLPQGLARSFLAVSIPLESDGLVLNLTQMIVPPSKPGVVSVILDVDVIKPGIKIESDDEIWEWLEVLRKQKNRAFESCITNHTRELIS